MTKQNCTIPEKPLQAKPVKFTESVFLERAIKQHGDAYSYDDLGFISAKHKVKIFCKKCNNHFKQMPHNHANGQGCPDCAIKRRIKKKTRTTEDFIAEAIKVHGNLYDYSESVYKPLPSKIKIFCNRCKDFFHQQGQYHVSGQGCAKCGGKEKLTTNGFIEKAIKLRGSGGFVFDKVDYVNSHTKVIITCVKHGDFLIKPNSFLNPNRSGCKKCGIERKRNARTIGFREFVARAREHHGDSYKYYKHEYKKSSEMIRIHCPTHGDFYQLGTDHMRGRGCQYCSKINNGFGRSSFKSDCAKNGRGHGVLYIIKCYDEVESFYKIGITSRTIKRRYSSGMPYQYEVVAEVREKAGFIFDLENKIISMLRHHKYQPERAFKGSVTECFETIDPVESLIVRLSNTKQLQLLA